MLSIDNLYKQYGNQVLFEEASLFVGAHDRLGLVAPNGSGKTTLLRMILGQESPDAGTVRLDSHRSVDVLSQESQCRLDVTVREEMQSAFREAQSAQKNIEVLAAKLETSDGDSREDRAALRELSDAQIELDAEQPHLMEARIGRVLHGLGFDKGAPDRLTNEYSGGWQMRIAMAKLLLRQPDLLLLDEPTNHLDEKARKWLQGYLDTYNGAVVVISHEPRFLDAVCDRIVEIEEFKLISYTGNYTQYQKQKADKLEQQMNLYEKQQRELDKQQEFIDRFRAKASKATQVKSREKMLDKIEKVEAPRANRKAIAFQFPEAPKSAAEAIRLRGVSKNYGDNVVLLDINLKIGREDRLALLGPNGAGKSTLLRILAGVEDPSEGTRELGRNAVVGYFAQHQAEALDQSRTVMQEVLHGLERQPEGVARGLLGRLLFHGDEVFKEIRVLSGGERSRVALAKFLMRPANVLILDEPTNHLDVASRMVLQDALQNFEGALLVASHDQTFIKAVATEAYTVEDGMIQEKRTSLAPPKKGKGK